MCSPIDSCSNLNSKVASCLFAKSTPTPSKSPKSGITHCRKIQLYYCAVCTDKYTNLDDFESSNVDADKAPFSARGQDTYRVDYAHSEGQAALGRDPREYLVQTKSFRASAKDSSGHGQREVSAIIFILADLDILQIPRLKIWYFALQLKALAAQGPIEGWCCRGSQADSCWQGRQWGPFLLDSCPWVAGWDARLLQTPVVWNEVWQLL